MTDLKAAGAVSRTVSGMMERRNGGSARWLRPVLGLAVALALAGCETPTPPANGEVPGPETPDTPSPAPDASGGGFTFATSGDTTFDDWRASFASQALGAGRGRAAIESVLDGLIPLEEQFQVAAIEQAEFVKPIWDYAKSAVSPTRVSTGRSKLADNATALTGIEAEYAPPREILGAIWGMESSYGAVIGNIDAPRALATQAAKGRRQSFNETELMAIMQLIEDGSATRTQFAKASWAGALGQTQFMPTTFLRYGRDFDHDGHKDLWANPGDALASAANYLTQMGWKKNQPWALEVGVPDGFDYSLGDGRKKSLAEWKALGLAPANPVVANGADALSADLFLPAGSYGPAFLLFDNFYAIKKYNNADSYALAIGLLADQLAGRPELSRPWPTNIQMLTTDQAMRLQGSLNTLGFNAGAVDGIIGRGTRGALQRFQKAHGLLADGFPTQAMLTAVLNAAGD
ncbi:MAG: lytic murein transglycosylase [Hyphomonadaceae bacterium]